MSNPVLTAAGLYEPAGRTTKSFARNGDRLCLWLSHCRRGRVQVHRNSVYCADADVVILTLGRKHGICSMVSMGGRGCQQHQPSHLLGCFYPGNCQTKKPLIGVHFDGRPSPATKRMYVPMPFWRHGTLQSAGPRRWPMCCWVIPWWQTARLSCVLYHGSWVV